MIEPNKKVVLFPVEIVARELDFRLMLAAYCARADTQIVIGRQHLLQLLLLRLRNGLFVGKNLASWKSPQEYGQYKARGFRTIFLPEEGGVYQGGPKDWKKSVLEQLNVEQIEPEDYVCCWGEFQADCYRQKNPRCLSHIQVTGHPRFDLVSPIHRKFFSAEARTLREKYGPFILVNTNFLWNNAKGRDFNFHWYGIKPTDAERRTFYLDQILVSSIKWARFIQLINYLSDHFPKLGIVVRPHPSESIHSYTNLLRHVPRVTVIRDGGLQAWLLASEAVIHDGCTTAIEGWLAGGKVINFSPITDERFEPVLPNLVGVRCVSEVEVEEALRRLLADASAMPTVTPENAARIKEMIDNFGSSENAFQKLAGIVHQMLDEVKPTQVTGITPVLGRQRLKDALWRLLQPLDPAGWQRKFGKRDRGYQKFPPLQRRDIEDKIRLIRQITGRPIRVRFHSSRLLSVFLES